MHSAHIIDGSRDYDCCRYFDLIKRIEEFYADGQITPEELIKMQDMRGETLLNYQVALGMLSKIDSKDKHYQKLTELADYLRLCWLVMDQAYDKGTLVQQKKEAVSEKQGIPKKKEKLIINVAKDSALLLASLSTSSKRREFEMEEVSKKIIKSI